MLCRFSRAQRPQGQPTSKAPSQYTLVETNKASNITPRNDMKAFKGMLLLAPLYCAGRQVLKLDTAQRNCRRTVAKAAADFGEATFKQGTKPLRLNSMIPWPCHDGMMRT